MGRGAGFPTCSETGRLAVVGKSQAADLVISSPDGPIRAAGKVNHEASLCHDASEFRLSGG